MNLPMHLSTTSPTKTKYVGLSTVPIKGEGVKVLLGAAHANARTRDLSSPIPRDVNMLIKLRLQQGGQVCTDVVLVRNPYACIINSA